LYVETKKVVYQQDTTVVSPFSILLFGGTVNFHHHVLIVNNVAF